MSFDWATIFSVASSAALAAWLALILLPRWRLLLEGMRVGLIGVFAILYAALMFTYFYRVEGGGYGSLDQVARLFSSEPVLLAGWVHYLAFDLFVGLWIAEKADEDGLSRLIQTPILLATFMFGPLGLLLFYGTRLARRRAAA